MELDLVVPPEIVIKKGDQEFRVGIVSAMSLMEISEACSQISRENILLAFERLFGKERSAAAADLFSVSDLNQIINAITERDSVPLSSIASSSEEEESPMENVS